MVLALALTPLAAHAQSQGQVATLGGNVKSVIEDFNKGLYADAAYRFFDITENDSNQANQLAAEYFLGASLLKLKFYQPAYYYFSGILKTGPNHPFFEKAVEGMVDVSDSLRDDLFIPELFMRFYTPEFSRLPAEKLNKINYMVGELASRKGKNNEAMQFLGAVPKNSRYYTRAKYLTGMILYKAKRVPEAVSAFNEIIKATEDKKKDEFQASVRNLAIMALGRIAYKDGDFKKSIEKYEAIPRFTSEWVESLFEAGWAYLQLQDYGTSLGRVFTLFAPNYQEQFQPEAYILQATVYFYSCLYDEAKDSLVDFYKRYKPMPDALAAVLTSQQASPEYFFGLVAGAPLTQQNEVPMEIRKNLRANPRFKGFVNFWLELEREKNAVDSAPGWKTARFGQALKQMIGLHQDLLTKAIGKWTQIRLQSLYEDLVDFMNQAQLIDFETVNEQRKLLTAAAPVSKDANTAGKDKKLPRPKYDSFKTDYWSFNQEYWVDELGYYYFTLRRECK